MRRAFASLLCLTVLFGSVSARAAGPTPVRLSPEARELFAAAVTAYRAGDWAQAERDFGEVSRIAAPIAEYALLQQAESLARLGDLAGSRAAGGGCGAGEPGRGARPSPCRGAGLPHRR